ncbi:MAG TPA: glucoamylase family protein [Methylotenera sp.]|nr:glucoamylase family protein [Methylotenera sp.]
MEQLKRHAITLAKQHRINPNTGPDKLLARLKDNARVILNAYNLITLASTHIDTPGHRLVAGESWLLDNFYLIEQQITLARRHLPRGYSKQLPRLSEGKSEGYPRIYDLALVLISHMDGRVDHDNTTEFIAAYQTAQPLMLGELWAFPIMLQLALLENLRRVALRIASRREEQNIASIWADRMLAAAENEPKQLIQLLAEFASADIPLTAPFVEEFYARLQDQGAAMAFVQTWVEQELLLQGTTATKLLESASRSAAANQISIANSIGSLRFIGATDWRKYVESLSVVEQILHQDPAEMYPVQDFPTRDNYRHAIERISRAASKHHVSTIDRSLVEVKVANMAVALAKLAFEKSGGHHLAAHVGYYLIDDGIKAMEEALDCDVPLTARFKRGCKPYHLCFYLAPIFVTTLVFTSLILFLIESISGSFGLNDWHFWFFAIAGFIGSSALGVSLTNIMVTKILKPRNLPRLDFSAGVPDSHRTMVVVPTLINSVQEIDSLIEALEIRYLGNRDQNILFALLTDFYDAPEQTIPADAALLTHIIKGIDTLNATYHTDRPSIFYLFHRQREWNPIDKVWMGYERKRGKLEQFNALLRGANQTAFTTIVGDTSVLHDIQYVITLDTDTQLPRDSAKMLIGNMAHPINRPVFDANKGRIVRGYAILQPRASTSLISSTQSWFTKLYAGESGIDPYTRAISDVYQDVFEEGSFIGKGIYDVDAFRLAVDGRFPTNLILSHDLLECGYARSALVTDVDLIEEHPASYTMDISRRHRWVRGDWQLLGWLLPSVPAGNGLANGLAGGLSGKRQPNPLSSLTIWKIFDNLRRSLVPLALFALLLGCWLVVPLPATVVLTHTVPYVWALETIVLAILFIPSVLVASIELVSKPKERDWVAHIVLTNKSANKAVFLGVLSLVFLPYEAALNLGAILRSAGRRLLSKRGLLQWHLPSYAKRNARVSLADFYKEMWVAPVIALLLTVYLIYVSTLHSLKLEAWLLCGPILLLWLLSPIVAWWISKPLLTKLVDLTLAQRLFLQTSARRTWRYFAEFVGPDDHWLPPDNVQQYPTIAIASRTSPTNIGMGLLANLAAYDFGYITAGELLNLTANTLTSMEKLERYHGHFYNWYDTRTLQVLRPQYVSSVDSGNLMGSLLTLQAGLAELRHQPIVHANTLQGLSDTLLVLSEFVPTLPAKDFENKIKFLQEKLLKKHSSSQPKSLFELIHLLTEIKRHAHDLTNSLPIDIDEQSELYYWTHAFEQQSTAILDELKLLMPTTVDKSNVPSLADLASHNLDAHSLLLSIAPSHLENLNYSVAMTRLASIDNLIKRITDLAEMDFEFLYNTSNDLLSIGYDVGERRRDVSCYDLLASEARLASFLLIAKGQLPQTHWFSLGRLLTSIGGDISLISWSGSMFEYLMPRLLMPSFENTLLDETCKAVVKRQIKYGQQRGTPWGISESCYNATDIDQVYQYRAFGVPGLGFKRGLADDLVIAPYATALSLMVMPNEACRNLQKLADSGFLGQYGFYEAIDYTPNRLPRGKNHAAVMSFMAHHQGMSLLSFAHVLLDKPMQHRFMMAPYLKATELLLQERIPKQGATLHPHATEADAGTLMHEKTDGATMRVFTEPNTLIPEVHLLSNGRYHVMATNAGGGYSRWHDLAVTRWREDATTDHWGTFIYLRDRDTERYWSSAHQPTLQKADHYEAIFSQARAEYRRRDQSIETHTEISVSPEDDVEIRRVTLTNLSNRNRNIEITSFAEVVLAPLNADLAHRSFSNLFVQTEILHDRQAIICTRRPRTAGERVPWMFHLMAATGINIDQSSYETDRAKFIGRGRSAANPIMFDSDDADEYESSSLIEQVSTQISGQLFRKQSGKTVKPLPLSNTDGSVLDPIVAIRRMVSLEADKSATVQIISGVTNSREAALALVDKYCDRHFVERAFEMAWFQSKEVLRMINASEADAQVFGRLASSVIYCNTLRRAPPNVITRNQLGQSGLWRFGISGDFPIVLLRIGDISRLNLVREVLQAHTYWRMHGLVSDLLIINEDFSGYRADLQDQIIGLINTGPEAQTIDKPGGVFIRRTEELSEEARVLFQTIARVMFTDSTEKLIDQTERRISLERLLERVPERLEPSLQPVDFPVMLQAGPLIFNNGRGGFTPDGREYVIILNKGQTTPAPWANVIASPHIGTVVSESGSAYTWVENAHEFRLTTWHNDPLSDTSGEAQYIRDEETGLFWSPTPLPAFTVAQDKSNYICRHGFGYSVFEHAEAGIYSEMMTYVAMDAPVKFVVIKLRNLSQRTRKLSLTGYWELVLGEWRHSNMMHIVTETDAQTGAIFARNAYGRECANRVVFAHMSEKDSTITGNRTEFIGRNGSLSSPAGMRRKRLSGKTGAGIDPCAAIQTQLTLLENEEREFVFIFGAAKNTDEARNFIQRFSGPARARQALDAVYEYWNHTLGAVQVETPDSGLNVLANGWLIYQTISSRLWGRSGYYQSGGAYGFRDQLQDTMALIHTTPWLAREQIIRCAERQFPQGDVQHWWHPPNGQGVRTHFSDDYLWLAYATCRYVAATGDRAILDESVHFLEGRSLNHNEEAYYDQPLRSNEHASVYEHCVRAIKYGLRFGSHQLPLIGCGDWNDGMNLIGQDGKGESVWLAWFLVENLNLFSAIAKNKGDVAFYDACITQAVQLKNNIESNAWDGAWYRRAYFDDGTPLGSKDNIECQIDSISQSWAIISQTGDPERARQAMSEVNQRLVQRDAHLIKLLTPPFDRSALEPGYIKGYVPGVRENGGQYTHAAIWATMAFAMMNDQKSAWELFAMLNPINHASTPDQIETYKVEPYVMSADIYATAPHTGRGGWTWYTGAAGWMYRLTVETLLGIYLENDHLRISPCIPSHWQSYKIHYRYRDTLYHISINCKAEQSDFMPKSEYLIPIVDDRQEHHVEINLN